MSNVDGDFWGNYDRCRCGAVPGEPCISMRPHGDPEIRGALPRYNKRPHTDRPKRAVELSDFRHTMRAGRMPEQLAALREKLLSEIELGAAGRDLVAVGKELLALDPVLPPDLDRTRGDLSRLRDRLAQQIDEADDRAIPPREVAAMVRLLRDVVVILDRVPASEVQGSANVIGITERVAAKRRQAESLADPADSDRDVRPGSG